MTLRHRSIMSAPRSRGLGALAAIVVLVMLSALAAAVVRLGWSSHSGIAQDVTSARALRAANAGIEWGLYQAFEGSWANCVGSSTTLDLRADTGMWVSVSCTSETFNEGQTQSATTATVTVYRIEAVACNGVSSCPDNAKATGPYYVERSRVVQATN